MQAGKCLPLDNLTERLKSHRPVQLEGVYSLLCHWNRNRCIGVNMRSLHFNHFPCCYAYRIASNRHVSCTQSMGNGVIIAIIQIAIQIAIQIHSMHCISFIYKYLILLLHRILKYDRNPVNDSINWMILVLLKCYLTKWVSNRLNQRNKVIIVKLPFSHFKSELLWVTLPERKCKTHNKHIYLHFHPLIILIRLQRRHCYDHAISSTLNPRNYWKVSQS